MKKIIIAAALAVTAAAPAFAIDARLERQFYTSNVGGPETAPTRSVVAPRAQSNAVQSLSEQRERAFSSSNPL